MTAGSAPEIAVESPVGADHGLGCGVDRGPVVMPVGRVVDAAEPEDLVHVTIGAGYVHQAAMAAPFVVLSWTSSVMARYAALFLKHHRVDAAGSAWRWRGHGCRRPAGSTRRTCT
jgi:hypothetical protein